MEKSERTAPALLALEDLRSCDEVAGVKKFFEQLGYAVSDTTMPLAKADFSFSPREADVIDRVFLIAELEPQWRVVLFKSKPGTTFRGRFQPIARTVLQNDGDYFLIFAEGYPFTRLTFVHPRRLDASQVQICKLAVDVSSPKQFDLQVLEACAIRKRSAEKVFQAHAKAFDAHRSAAEFGCGLRELRARVADQVWAANRNVTGFRKKAILVSFAQRLLNRFIFLYFIQRKGWLANEPEFLTRWYRQIVDEQGKAYYHDFVEKLFFETLNLRRLRDASPWGNLPYLDGGLFEKDYVVALDLPNELFDPESSDSILGFFNQCNFSLDEDTLLERNLGLGLDALDIAFAGICEEEKREKQPTLDVPPVLVEQACQRALLNYLTHATQLSRELLHFQFEEEPHKQLAPPQAEAVEQALRHIDVFDPAVGTGTFLLKTLREWVALRRACWRVLNPEASIADARIGEWKREFIAKCLYGVDTRGEAIETTKLRLWLAIIIDTERAHLEPLPNLDYKLMRGNLLIETLAGQPILTDADEPATFRDPVTGQLTLGIFATEKAITALRRLDAQYAQADSAERAKLRARIHHQETEIVRTHLKERQNALEHRIKKLLKQGRQVRWRNIVQERRKLDALRSRLIRTAKLNEEIRHGAVLPFFLYHLHHKHIFDEKGGFDIVLGVLPVTQDGWTIEGRTALRNEYPHVYDYRANVSVYFCARGLDLLNRQGTLAFIVRDVLLKAGASKKLRDYLIAKASLQAMMHVSDSAHQPASSALALVLEKEYADDARVEYFRMAGLAASDGNLAHGCEIDQRELGSDWLATCQAEWRIHQAKRQHQAG